MKSIFFWSLHKSTHFIIHSDFAICQKHIHYHQLAYFIVFWNILANWNKHPFAIYFDDIKSKVGDTEFVIWRLCCYVSQSKTQQHKLLLVCGRKCLCHCVLWSFGKHCHIFHLNFLAHLCKLWVWWLTGCLTGWWVWSNLVFPIYPVSPI